MPGGVVATQRTLNPLTQVRILAGQPGDFLDYLGASGGCPEPFFMTQKVGFAAIFLNRLFYGLFQRRVMA